MKKSPTAVNGKTIEQPVTPAKLPASGASDSNTKKAGSQPQLATADLSTTGKGTVTTTANSAGWFIWLVVVVTLFVAAASLFYSYTQSQQSSNAYIAQRELLLERINQLERQQHSLLADTNSQQQQFVASMDKRLENIKQQFATTPNRIAGILAAQLIHQSQILSNLNAPRAQVIVLLEEAYRIVRNSGLDSSYNSVINALQADLALLEAEQSKQSIIAIFTSIDRLRSQIRQLSFTPSKRPLAVSTSVNNPDVSDDFWQRIQNGATNFLGELVVVSRREGATNLNLNQKQFVNIKLLIESTLAQAQLAVMLNDASSFTKSLEQASLLTSYLLPRYPLEDYRKSIISLQQTSLPRAIELNSAQAIANLKDN